MKSRGVVAGFRISARCATFALMLSSATALAQAPQTSGPPPGLGPVVLADMTPGPIPRSADGKPDLTGIWQIGFDLKAYFPKATLAAPEPVGFTGGMPAYRADAMGRIKGAIAGGDPVLRCLPWGVLRQPGLPMPTQLVQTRSQLIVLYEYFHSYRVIPVNANHRSDLIPSYMGDSVGRWDGDTFVVDVIGFNDETWIGEPGTIHTEDMHVVERYTLINEKTLRWEAAVDDAAVLAQPWKLTLFLSRMPPETRLLESMCTDTATSEHVSNALK